ncbi:MAG: sigma-70 family RNA polymerase sigma factor [Balneolaceae bacterium]
MLNKKEETFRELFSEHYAMVVKVCRLYSDSEEDNHDNIQEVALQLWKSFDSFEGRSKISTWIYRVALNVCMFQLKKRKRNRKVKDEWLEHIPEDDLERKKELEEQSGILSDAIKQLKEIDRAIILLYLEEVPYKEISEILGITVTNVGARINRIKTRLKEIIHG